MSIFDLKPINKGPSNKDKDLGIKFSKKSMTLPNN